MRQFFISTHGTMASGIKEAIRILLGNAKNVTVFDAYINQDRVEDHVEAWLQKVSEGDQAIMLSDLYGGSVNQILYRYLEHENTMLVAGVSLALVLELVSASEQPLTSEDLDQLIEQSRNAMVQCRLEKDEVQQEEFF
ncbi:MAG: PTS sugar transporter subunit IIA [Erysipelotrichia bacterium]|nr:PTS sugar transporter subunit IIA [Erysipelotrichia bacterium]